VNAVDSTAATQAVAEASEVLAPRLARHASAVTTVVLHVQSASHPETASGQLASRHAPQLPVWIALAVASMVGQPASASGGLAEQDPKQVARHPPRLARSGSEAPERSDTHEARALAVALPPRLSTHVSAPIALELHWHSPPHVVTWPEHMVETHAWQAAGPASTVRNSMTLASTGVHPASPGPELLE
jgi:hypothetical protein